MRLRVCVLACALALLGSVAAGMASAASQQNPRLTIATAPNPVIAGQGVLIYGRLFGLDNGNQTIRLYHHVAGARRGYTLVTTTTTDPMGYYEFPRPEGLVYTDRNWYVRGPDGTRSRTVDERVIPLVSITPSATTTDTNHSVVFSGHVIPNHRFEQVFLQQQIGSTRYWQTLRSTTLDPGSNYFVAYRWRRPGQRDVRVLFKGDRRNARGSSTPITISVEQAQVRGFTINSSAPVVASGGAVKITGTLDRRGTSTADPGTIVQLWGRTPDHPFQVIADAVTGSGGSYSFTESNVVTNTVYYVATMPGTHAARRHTSLLYQDARDVVTMQTTSTGVSSGQTVTFTGTVLPDKAGRVIALQMLGSDGDWHTIQLAIVHHDSAFIFTQTIGAPGTSVFRARITSDEDNVGSASPPVAITAKASPASALPPTS